MLSLPDVINHAEIARAGTCEGEVVRRGPNVPVWDCVDCEASYTDLELHAMQWAYNHEQQYRLNQEAAQDLAL